MSNKYLGIRLRLPSMFAKICRPKGPKIFRVPSRIRAEIRCPGRISSRISDFNFTSIAGRQNKPFYEQNLSKPNIDVY